MPDVFWMQMVFLFFFMRVIDFTWKGKLQREIFHLPIHSPDSHSCQRWSSTKELGTPFGSSICLQEPKHLNHPPLLFQGPLTGSRIRSGETRTQQVPMHMGCRLCSQRHNPLHHSTGPIFVRILLILEGDIEHPFDMSDHTQRAEEWVTCFQSCRSVHTTEDPGLPWSSCGLQLSETSSFVDAFGIRWGQWGHSTERR